MIDRQSAYRALQVALADLLSRNGVFVGTTAGYPRIEVHSVTENSRLDKNGDLRMMTATIEVITTDSIAHAHRLNEENLQLLDTNQLATEANGFRVVGIILQQLQDLPETSDTQNTLYRILQSIDVYIERIEVPEPEPESEPDNNESQTE